MTDTLQSAAAAVRDYYASDGHLVTPTGVPRLTVATPYSPTWVAARDAIEDAIKDGHTLALIAATANLRQLLLVQFIEPLQDRRQALRVARADAERYLQQVTDQMISEARREFGNDVPKSTIADGLGISRVTLDKWLAEE